MDIRGIAYFGLQVPDIDTWVDFAEKVVGLQRVAPRAGVDVVQLAADARRWRVALHEGSPAGLAYLGLEVSNQLDFENAQAELERAGVLVTAATADELRTRGVAGMCHFTDPEGSRLELCWGMLENDRFNSPIGAKPYVGVGGFGHLVLLVADLAASMDFYQRILRFRMSDYTEFGEGMGVYFFRCSPRHHSVALSAVGGIKGLHHIAFQAVDVDQVGLALDRAMHQEVRITATLGRHKNDRMLSFYMRSPAGFDVEIGCDPRLIDDDSWVAVHSTEGDLWGHHGLTSESLADTRKAIPDAQ